MYYWRKINFILLFALVILIVPSVYLLLLPGFFVTDDGTWMIIRLSAFFDTLKDGQIPVRLLERLNNGYGYPVTNFLYPGFLYLGSVIHILGFNFIDSVKVVLIMSMISSGIFSYFWLKKIFDPIAAFIGALFYIYTPYHLYDLYKRGSVGEILALAFVPFILWQIERKSLSFISIGIFLLIISHNSLALLFLPLIILYGAIAKKMFVLLCGILIGIAMSAFFIIPAIFELGYTKFSTTSISDPSEYFATLDLIGICSLAVVATCFLVFLKLKKSFLLYPHKGLILLFLGIACFSIFLSLPLSHFIWSIIPSQFIQFPFRVLSLLLIGNALLASFVISKTKGITRNILLVIFLLCVIVSSLPYLKVQERTQFPEEYYSTNMDTTTVKNEYLPTWVKVKPDKAPENLTEVLKGSAQAKLVEVNSRKILIDLTESENSQIRIHRIYYPGWSAYLNNEKVSIDYNNDLGVMDVNVNREGLLTVVFHETPLRFASNTITILSLLFVLYLLLRPILKFK